MREKPLDIAGILGAFDMAGLARALALIAKTAWYLAFVTAALVILAYALWFYPIYVANMSAARQVFAIIVFCAGSLFFIPSSPVPFWIVFAFIWFFAAWGARVAERQARREKPAPGK